MELMRGLAFVALLFAGSAVGAELRQAEVCTDGTTHQLGYCPAVLSSASCSATGATTGSCSATSDEADGTRYVCATSNNTALTGAEIEACSGGAAVAGSSAAETGSNSVSLSGLTTDAAHYGQIVNKSPEQWYSNRPVSGSFTPGGVPYDLSGLPFSVNWPTVPTTTSTINVTANDGAGLLAAIQTDGALVNVPAGTYSTALTGWGNDVDVVADNGATVSLTGSFDLGSSNRVRWTGGVIDGNNAQSFYQAGGSDHMFNNVRFDAMQSMLPGFATATRMAFVHVTVDSEEYVGFFSQTDLHTDIIYAASDLYGGNGGGQSTVRFMGVTRGVLVDSRLRNNTHHTYRVHYASDYIYAGGNQFETGNGILFANHPIGGGVLQCNRCWFVDNKVYSGWTAFSGYYASGTEGITVLTMTGNENYASSPSFPVFLDGASTGPGWDVSDNTDGLSGSPATMPGVGADH